MNAGQMQPQPIASAGIAIAINVILVRPKTHKKHSAPLVGLCWVCLCPFSEHQFLSLSRKQSGLMLPAELRQVQAELADVGHLNQSIDQPCVGVLRVSAHRKK
jgi:hypothetical protein